MSIEEKFCITDDGTERKYFLILPNIVDDMGLSPYAFRLYARIKRRAGENGLCFENSKHLAEGCNMSAGSVSKAKRELIEAGLITITTIPGRHGEFDHHEIRIRDIWAVNIEKYVNKSQSESACSLDEQEASQDESERSSHEPKKNPINKNQYEEEYMAPSSFSEKEIQFLKAIGLMYGYYDDTYQSWLVRLFRKFGENNTLEAFDFYVREANPITEGFLVRVERALQNWNPRYHDLTTENMIRDLNLIGRNSPQNVEDMRAKFKKKFQEVSF